jgi:radical SAM protein with 4Fe4S-binding SPASM domain
MQVWSCFSLSSINKKSIFEFDTLKQAGEHFSQLMRNTRVEAGGIFSECDACDWRKKKVCHGGCAAHSLRKIDEEGDIRALKLT